ncbi:VOC family protein [Citricoccus sp. GCM10030269]|uniref:VOC family protein n=1 Tax=Citricoccus sp. GCM10030269 TaxID=3273388 RepID=UPI00361A008C
MSDATINAETNTDSPTAAPTASNPATANSPAATAISAGTASGDQSTFTVGSPVWVDLNVPDLTAVQGFYESLFGWEFEDMGPDFGHYHLITRHGAAVGGAMSMAENDSDEAPAWMVYLKSDDIEKSLTDTAAAGGDVIVPAMPMPELGTMGVVTSPGGEVMGVWQPNRLEGFVLDNSVGSPAWFEVMSFNYDVDAEYYRTVWGWEPVLLGEDGKEQPDEGGDAETEDAEAMGRYANNHRGENATAGLCEPDPSWFPEGTPSYWQPYFSVENADAAVDLIRQQGGSVLDGPLDTPFGRLATVTDPAGASFQIAELTQQ